LPKVAVFLVCAVIAGCATSGTAPRSVSDEDHLKTRVKAYWTAKIDGDEEACYRMEDPVFRKTWSLTEYIRAEGRIAKWMKAEVVDMNLTGSSAVVTMDTVVRIRVPQARAEGMIPRKMTERWAKVDGEWYRVTDTGKGLNSRRRARSSEGQAD